MSRWTKFQTDCLLAVAELEREASRGPTGQEVKARLETAYGYEVGQGRLYTNLDRLADERYLRKLPLTGRSNSHELTEAGERFLRRRRR
ncbi:helix-turn-helix transcriptional regulator, partial [Halobium palmae]